MLLEQLCLHVGILDNNPAEVKCEDGRETSNQDHPRRHLRNLSYMNVNEGTIIST